MTENSDNKASRLVHPMDPLLAASLLTVLPLPVDHQLAGRRSALASWAYPLVGLLIGLILLLVAKLLLLAGAGTGLIAALLLLLATVLSGALHEDGLADFADGLGGHTPEKRLAIMRDSHIGAFGVIALILVFLCRWVAIDALLSHGQLIFLLALPALSRLPMVIAMGTQPNARTDGLASHTGRPAPATMLIATASALFIAVVCLGFNGLMICLALTAISAILIRFANKRLGGITGDVLGTLQQLSEVTALVTLILLT